MYKEYGKQHIQFIAEICTNHINPPLYEKKNGVQICAADGFTLMDTNMIWSPEGDLYFRIFGKKGKQLKYIRKGITHVRDLDYTRLIRQGSTNYSLSWQSNVDYRKIALYYTTLGRAFRNYFSLQNISRVFINTMIVKTISL